MSFNTTKNKTLKGRGTLNSCDPRYLSHTREVIDDGWSQQDTEPKPFPTTVTVEKPRTIITRNQSPDVPFDASINPYRGCEHGCVYCYARPSHAYMDLSPGLDFESKLFAKPNAATLLESELRKANYRCTPIALGANTDPYQPIERNWRITRQIIEVLSQCRHPFAIITKSSLVERDLDLLAPMARDNLVEVYVSVTSLDAKLARKLEPRAAAPLRRIETIRRLTEAGIPTGVLFAPVIPALNDTEMEAVLQAAVDAGARYAGYVMLRLPHEIKDLFKEWLEIHAPLKAKHVMNMIRDIRGGKEYDSAFSTRMRGTGVYADMIHQRFHRSCQQLGINKSYHQLDINQFSPPLPDKGQLALF